ncbi:MAG: restriction endonuclease [Lachnospiraceae bacterium]|nr:restriction endonuclease [Lachnospiraceae bacterium]
MIFIPYEDEQNVINMIHEVRNSDYALLRLTPTMIGKNNIDANGIFREMLAAEDIVDYEIMENGGENGVSVNALYIQKDKTTTVKLKFYRVSNQRGDRRFSLQTIKRKAAEGEMNVDDLIYFSTFRDENDDPVIYIINLTSNVPTKERLVNELGKDEISQKFDEIKPMLEDIVNSGWHDNSKGVGEKAPKDVGDTLEALLKVGTNNRTDADIAGLIEVKAKGKSRTLDTLFTLRPSFDGTEVALYERTDRNRVSAFARLYGYYSEKHPNCKSLYITIGSKDAPQNNQGFYLQVDDDNKVVNLMKTDENGKKDRITAYWTFEALRKQLMEKHPSTLWVSADERTEGEMVQFKYKEIEFSRAPQFATFLALINAGIITYDWRGYTSETGAYSGKNHGNAWRIKPAAKEKLFGDIKKITL